MSELEYRVTRMAIPEREWPETSWPVPSPVIKPLPPPGAGWKLATMTVSSGYIYYAWKRQKKRDPFYDIIDNCFLEEL